MTIELPADAPRKPRGKRPDAEPSTPATTESVQQTLAEYERLAIGTGEWNGTEAPEFSDYGTAWSAAWMPSEGQEHPTFARATVYRKGIKRPIIVVIRWDEALPAVDEWRDLWMRKPVALFGAFALRAALRRAFRDAIGDQRGPDEHDREHDEEATA